MDYISRKIANIEFIRILREYYSILKDHQQDFLPRPISKTYDKEVKKLANIIFHDFLPFKYRENYYNNFMQKFTTRYSIRQQWFFECTHQMEIDNLLTKENLRKCQLDVFEDTFHHFSEATIMQWHNPGILNSQPSHVLLKVLVENGFLFENELKEICRRFWNFGDNREKFLEFSIPWYKINIASLKGLKCLPQIKTSLDVFYKVFKANSAETIPEWIKAFEETEDAEYIGINIEQRIHDEDAGSTEEEHNELWNFLFQVSRHREVDKLLNVFSRYCRLYVDDLNKRNEYRQELENAIKTHPNLNFENWILDSIKLEYDFGSKKSAKNMLSKFVKEGHLDSKFINCDKKLFKKNSIVNKICIKQDEEKSLPGMYFTKTGTVKQDFDLPLPLMTYICKYANYGVTQKLQASSKQICLLSNQIICLKFSISDIPYDEIFEETIFISAKNSKIDKIKNLAIFNTLFVSHPEGNTLSKFIPKFSKCNLKYLMLVSQNLTLQEYNFLTNSKTIEGIAFISTTVKTSENNDERVSLEDLFKNLSNAENIAFVPSPFIHYETFDILGSLERTTKIRSFYLSSMTENFSPSGFCYFIKNCVAPNSNISMYYKNVEDYQYLLPSIQEMLDSWQEPSEMPQIKIEIGA